MVTEEETGLVPAVGGAMNVSDKMAAELAALAQTGEELGGTLLDMLGIYSADRDRWKQGETKKDQVIGIYLHSLNSMRKFWPPEAEMGGTAPHCWSLGGEDAVPHANSADIQHPTCEGCPWDEFNTAKQGKGKGCKTARADFIVEVDPENLEQDDNGAYIVTAENVMGIALIRASATAGPTRKSIGQWAKSVQSLTNGVAQLVLTKWDLEEVPQQGGRPLFYAPTLKVMGKVAFDPDALLEVVTMAKEMRNGQAEEVLVTLAGTADEEEEGED